MQDYILNPGVTLKKSLLMILGCDRKITANPHWEKDLMGDMEARVRYSYIQEVPSIATSRADNDVTVQRAITKMSLYHLLKSNTLFNLFKNPTLSSGLDAELEVSDSSRLILAPE